MVPLLYRSTAQAWLAFFEFSLLPLRVLAAPAPAPTPDQRESQEEVWRVMGARRVCKTLTGPVFTDEVIERARSLS